MVRSYTLGRFSFADEGFWFWPKWPKECIHRAPTTRTCPLCIENNPYGLHNWRGMRQIDETPYVHGDSYKSRRILGVQGGLRPGLEMESSPWPILEEVLLFQESNGQENGYEMVVRVWA